MGSSMNCMSTSKDGRFTLHCCTCDGNDTSYRLQGTQLTLPGGTRSSLTSCEGPLLKYKPGLSHDYVERWCEFTGDYFAYYKNQDAAALRYDHPLELIPLSDILSVEPVNSDAFEIILKDEDSALAAVRKSNDDPSVLNSLYTDSTKGAVQDGKLMKKPFRNSKSPNRLAGLKNSWTRREVEWFASEKRLLFSADTQEARDCWVDTLKTAITNNSTTN